MHDVGYAVHSVLGLLVKAAKRPARRDPETGAMVLEFGRKFIWTFIVILTCVSVSLLVASQLVSFKHSRDRYPLFVIAGTILLFELVVGLYFLNTRLFVFETRIEFTTPLAARKQLNWCDISSVRYCMDGTLKVSRADGQSITVNPMMIGILEFASILRSHLPARTIEASQGELDKFDKFLARF